MKERNLFLLVFIILLMCFLVSKIDTDNISITGFVTKLPDVSVEKQLEIKLEKEEYVDVIIKLKDKKGSLAAQESVLGEIAGKKRSKKDVVAAKISKKEFEKLKNNPNVEGISQNRKFKVVLDQSVPQINVDEVWSKGLTGKGESVCVLDTGIDYNHAALQNRINGQHCFCFGCCPNGLDEDTDAMDDNNHGTHVSGIVASNGSIKGVAPGVNITAVKIGNSGGNIDGFDLYLGIDWCLQNKDVYNISVITMSLSDGGKYNSSDNCDGFGSIADKINEAINSGIFVSVATGNNGYTDGISYPACILNVTAVGAVDNSDVIYFNRGDLLDVLAPGIGIYSTIINGYGSMSGTSMSTPHVAGAAILLRQYARLQGYSLSPEEINDFLKNTGKDIGEYKRIDVLKAIYSLDVVDPNVVLDSPENKMYITNIIDLNYSAKDVNLDSVWYGLENVNTSLSGNNSLNLSDGDYNLIVYVNDSNGNLNSTSVDFRIKVSALVVNLDAPVDDYEDIDGSVTLNCSASGVFDLVNVSLYTDINGNFSLEETKDVSGLSADVSFSINEISDNTDFIWGCKVENNISQNLFSFNRSVKIRINDAPVFSCCIENKSWDEDNNLEINLSDYFSDVDSSLSYSASNVSNISFSGGVLTPDADWYGERNVTFYASDGEFTAESNLVNLVVNAMPDCGDGTCEGNEDCSSCSADCGSCGGSPGGGSGGGGTPVETAPAAVEAPRTEESAVAVEAPVETGPEEITGGTVKDVEKSWFKEFLEITYLKVKLVFRKIWSFFRNIRLK